MEINTPIPENAGTEERILAAATREFALKGYYGARTQSIADAAGINKAMLHYYYRSKENLYSRVIRFALGQIQTRIWSTWLADAPLEERVERIVDAFIDSYNQNRGLLMIVLREVADGGERLRRILIEVRGELFPEGSLTPLDLFTRIGPDLGLSPVEAMHYLINIVGMCLISFISPIVLTSIGGYRIDSFDAFLDDRRKAAKATITAAVRELLEKKAGGVA